MCRSSPDRRLRALRARQCSGTRRRRHRRRPLVDGSCSLAARRLIEHPGTHLEPRNPDRVPSSNEPVDFGLGRGASIFKRRSAVKAQLDQHLLHCQALVQRKVDGLHHSPCDELSRALGFASGSPLLSPSRSPRSSTLQLELRKSAFE